MCVSTTTVSVPWSRKDLNTAEEARWLMGYQCTATASLEAGASCEEIDKSLFDAQARCKCRIVLPPLHGQSRTYCPASPAYCVPPSVTHLPATLVGAARRSAQPLQAGLCGTASSGCHWPVLQSDCCCLGARRPGNTAGDNTTHNSACKLTRAGVRVAGQAIAVQHYDTKAWRLHTAQTRHDSCKTQNSCHRSGVALQTSCIPAAASGLAAHHTGSCAHGTALQFGTWRLGTGC